MLKVGDRVVSNPNFTHVRVRVGIVCDINHESWMNKCSISVKWRNNGYTSNHFSDGRSLIKVG